MLSEERVIAARPYKEHLRERLKTAEDYRGYLNACHAEGPDTFALAVQDVFEFIATAMREECAARVRAMGQQWYGEAKKRGAAFSDKGRLAETIAAELESVTIGVAPTTKAD